MDILDLLLNADANKLKNVKKQYEVKRLSDALGEPFIVEISPLTNEQMNYVMEIGKDEKDTKLSILCESCKVGGHSFKEKEIMDKYGVYTPYELIEKIFLPGEIFEIYKVINDLSGFTKDAVVEIKNS